MMILLLSCTSMYGQRYSVSTDILGWADLATINAELSYAPARHFTLNLQGQYNNWNFGSVEKGNPFQDRVRGVAFGGRYWPWNVYSGLWMGAGLRAEEYNYGGFFRKMRTEEGRAVGGGLSFGYSLMLRSNLNIDFGVGLWAGRKDFTVYACPRCGRIVEQGKGFFVLPSSDTQISFVYIF